MLYKCFFKNKSCSFRSQVPQVPQALVQIWPSPRTTPRIASPQNGTETTSRNPIAYESLKGVDPKFLKNMCFNKKYKKKGLKKMQADNMKTMNACAKAVKALVKPKIPKGDSHKPNLLAYITHPKL